MQRKLQKSTVQSGFTLVELMVVLVIIGILGSIAIPGYTGYITDARRDVAQQRIQEIASRQEQFFMDNKTYASSLDELGYDDAVVGSNSSGEMVEFGDAEMQYAFVVWPQDFAGIDGATATDYRIAAVAYSTQASRDYECRWLYQDGDGRKWHAGTADECW